MLLDKAYPNALLFSVGLLLGSGQNTSTAAASPNQSAASLPVHGIQTGPPSQRTEKAAWAHPGVESEELATLRRAESEMFGQLDDLAEELAAVSQKLDGMNHGGALPTVGFDVPSRLGSGTPGFWESLRMPALAFTPNARVEKYIRFFTESASGRKTMITWLKRSGAYRDIILEALRRHDLPPDLIAVSFIESGLQPKAVSSAGAAGLWQFMPKTGRAYGLSVSPRYDERRSLWRSTDAAARHLTDLFAFFQSWELALASYNYGYERLAILSQRMATKDFWSLSAVEGALPRETVLYVPKVLAVAVILNNLDRFEMDDVSLDTPVSGAPLQVPGSTRLSLVARAAGTSLETIRSLNPEFRNDVVPRRDRPFTIYVPSDGLARARVMLPRLLEDPERNDEDTRVPDGFNWGRDEPGPAILDRLGNTVHGGREKEARLAHSYLRAAPTGNSTYFGEPPSPAPQVDSRALASMPMSTVQEVPATDPSAVCEVPMKSKFLPLVKESESPSTMTGPSSQSHEGGSKRRVKPRTDREIIFYVAMAEDTIQSVTSKFQVDEVEFRNINRMGRLDPLRAGTLLRIPVVARDSGRSASRDVGK